MIGPGLPIKLGWNIQATFTPVPLPQDQLNDLLSKIYKSARKILQTD